MKASELRCGNYVNVPRKEQSPFRVDYFDRVKVYQDNGTYECPTFGEIPMHPLTWDLSDIEGIVLTPEILEKCGFDYISEGFLYADKHHCIYEGGKEHGEIWKFQPFCTIDVNCTVSIKYMHQLQNLIFALEGVELEVKL